MSLESKVRHQIHAFLPALLLAATLPSRLPAQTLIDLLAQHGVAPDAAKAARANRTITSYAIRDSAGILAVAWYWATVPPTLPDTLNVSVMTRTTRSWSHAVLPREQKDSARGRVTYSVGSVTNIFASRDQLFLDTHITPSAGTLLILNRSLAPVAALAGWTKLLLPNGALLYSHNMVHFAATHPEELWLYNPSTGRDVLVYPAQPYDTLRRQYIERVRAQYTRLGPDWFRVNNHHMDPERFDNSIGTPIADPAGTRIAFIAMFGSRDSGPAKTPLVEVLVTCTDLTARSRCTESDLSALRRLHPGWSDEQVLQDALSRR